jgi:hypothetical protein
MIFGYAAEIWSLAPIAADVRRSLAARIDQSEMPIECLPIGA